MDAEIPVFWDDMCQWRAAPKLVDKHRRCPMYLWADDCQRNESNEKLVCCVFGHLP